MLAFAFGVALLLLSVAMARLLAGVYRCPYCGACRQDMHAPGCPWNPRLHEG
jgi:hypothetical protein